MILAMQPAKPDQPLSCPRCGSHQIHAGQAGWKFPDGFLGAFDLRLHCLQCGLAFRPPNYKPQPTSPALLWTVMVLGAVLLTMWVYFDFFF